MKTALTKLRQISMGLMAILSLSVASVAACACSHHQSEAEPQASCHSSSAHHSRKKMVPTGHNLSQSCECVASATKLSVKAEGFKLKKHQANPSAAAGLASTSFYATSPARSVSAQHFLYRSLLSYSTAARGPPLS